MKERKMLRLKPFKNKTILGDPAKTHFSIIDCGDENEDYFLFEKLILTRQPHKLKGQGMKLLKQFHGIYLFGKYYGVKVQTIVFLLNQLSERKILTQTSI